MWHVSSRSGVATCELLYTCYLLTYLLAGVAEDSASQSCRSDPDPVSTSSQAGGLFSTTSETAAESDQRVQPFAAAGGSQSPEIPPVSQSEVERSESESNAPAEDKKLTSADESPTRTNAQPVVALSPPDADSLLVLSAEGAETNKTGSKISGSSKQRLSPRKRAVRNTAMAAKIAGSWGKPAPAENAAGPVPETTDKSPASVENDATENRSSDRRKIRAFQNTLLAARVVGSPRPRSADATRAESSTDASAGSEK